MPVEVRLVDRGQALRRDARGRPHRSRGGGRRVLQPPRAVGLRQDDDPADDRRLRGADVGPDRAPGRGRHLAAAVQAQRQHGLPELRPLPAPHDLRERRLRPAPQGRQGQRGQGPRGGDARARRAAGLRAPQADPDLAAARPSASHSRGRSSTGPPSCCWTSRSARSTSSCASRCRSSSSASSRRSGSRSST